MYIAMFNFVFILLECLLIINGWIEHAKDGTNYWQVTLTVTHRN